MKAPQDEAKDRFYTRKSLAEWYLDDPTLMVESAIKGHSDSLSKKEGRGGRFSVHTLYRGVIWRPLLPRSGAVFRQRVTRRN